MKLPRVLRARLETELGRFRVVALTGPRQVGKSTLVASIEGRHAVTLDDLGVLAAAAADPRGFVRALPRPATIDEVQRVPELLLAIKEVVDADRRPGQFLVTGSSRIDTLRGIRESLAGRVALCSLRPMSWLELRGDARTSPIERLLACDGPAEVAATYARLRSAARPGPDDVVAGGFPEPALSTDRAARAAWFREYARAYVERDVPAIVRIEDVPAFARLLRAVAVGTGALINLADLARDLGVSADTARRWIGVLETTELAIRRFPWWRNLRKRLVKTPKLYHADSGVAASLAAVGAWSAAAPPPPAGALLETWVHTQLTAYAEVAEPPVELHFFRTHAQSEVDFLLVRGGRIVAVEVKSAETVVPADARGIEALAADVPRELAFGIVLYAGTTVFPLTPHAVAVPIGAFLATG